MPPVPLDLPLRPSDAAELANLVFTHAEKHPLTDDVRNRIAARAAPLKLETAVPWFGSLHRDPVHHHAYYLAVDSRGGESLLLHMAPAAAPTSSVFPKPLLIGRMRTGDGREIVVNSIPFGKRDHENIEKFAEKIDPTVLPRAQAPGPTLLCEDAVSGFEAFRAIRKRTGKNVAAVSAPYHEAVWAAIRFGWRQPYVACVELGAGDAARESVRRSPRYSRFLLSGDVAEVAPIAAEIRRARSAAKAPAAFELGISLPPGTAAEAIPGMLETLKTLGVPVQVVRLKLEPSQFGTFAAAVRPFQCILGLPAGYTVDELRLLARETAGRFSCMVSAGNSRELQEAAEEILG